MTNFSTQSKISLLWIMVLLNMGFADVLGLFIPGVLENVVDFSTEINVPITTLMLIGAIGFQIPLLMSFLSRVLSNRVNAYLNMFFAVLMSVYVVGGGSAWPHYILIATVEVICMLYIFKLALDLRKQ